MQSSKNNYLRITIIIFYLICSFFLTSIFFCFPLRLICTAWKLWKQVHGLLFFVKPLGFFQDGLSFEMGFFSRLHILWGYSVKKVVPYHLQFTNHMKIFEYFSFYKIFWTFTVLTTKNSWITGNENLFFLRIINK